MTGAARASVAWPGRGSLPAHRERTLEGAPPHDSDRTAAAHRAPRRCAARGRAGRSTAPARRRLASPPPRRPTASTRPTSARAAPSPDSRVRRHHAPRHDAHAVTPAPQRAGLRPDDPITIAFSGSHTDADTGAIGFECQLYNTAAAPATWTACTSPKTYTGLEDTTDHAVHVPGAGRRRRRRRHRRLRRPADLARPGCAGEEPLAPDADDVDARRRPLGFRVDTIAPNTFLDRRPVDRDPARLAGGADDDPDARRSTATSRRLQRARSTAARSRPADPAA